MWHDAETDEIPDALWPTDEGATVHVSLSRREAEAFLLAARVHQESSTALLTADAEIRHAIKQAFPELDES
jgi:hypothetical protein